MKKICVIGAGSSGLAAIKACREENMDVDCFEMSDNFGGLWRFHNGDADERPSIMKTTVINTSKEMSCFSDFPPPKEFANFMHHSYMLEYFRQYAEHFDLLKHIRYKCKVVKIVVAEDYKYTGRWKVSVQNLQEGLTFMNLYDGVMVCTGHHTFPHKPTFEGLDDFQGRVLHTHSLKSCDGFEDQKVLIIGIGNSGTDAAIEISRVSDKLYLSSRRGSWIHTKLALFGTPFDTFYLRRIFNICLNWNIFNYADTLVEFVLNLKFDHAKYGLKPNHRVLSAHTTVCDGLPSSILSGKVILKQNVSKFTKDGVIFEGESEITKVDAVVMATGYEIRFPFLSDKIVKVKKNFLDLYKLIFPANLSHPSLAFIGLVQPVGSIFPIAEAQSRWFAQLAVGRSHLPPLAEMQKEVEKRHEHIAKHYVNSPRHSIEVNLISYLDEIYAEFGAKPNLYIMALKDPRLFYACFTGPCVSYQYRLNGPHTWKGAREAILSVTERINAPLQTCKRS